MDHKPLETDKILDPENLFYKPRHEIRYRDIGNVQKEDPNTGNSYNAREFFVWARGAGDGYVYYNVYIDQRLLDLSGEPDKLIEDELSAFAEALDYDLDKKE